MKYILCFGDSNTYGHDPKDGSRLPKDHRWTGILASMLGAEYEVIEEGLCGRTTVLEDPIYQGRNGRTYFEPCMESHAPVDMIIFMLGTNDLQVVHNATPRTIAAGMEEVVKLARNPLLNRGKMPQILLLSPPRIAEVPDAAFFYELFGGSRAVDLSKNLAPLYREMAERYHCLFLDVASVVQPSVRDGIHLEPECHRQLAERLYTLLMKEAVKDFQATL